MAKKKAKKKTAVPTTDINDAMLPGVEDAFDDAPDSRVAALTELAEQTAQIELDDMEERFRKSIEKINEMIVNVASRLATAIEVQQKVIAKKLEAKAKMLEKIDKLGV